MRVRRILHNKLAHCGELPKPHDPSDSVKTVTLEKTTDNCILTINRMNLAKNREVAQN